MATGKGRAHVGITLQVDGKVTKQGIGSCHIPPVNQGTINLQGLFCKTIKKCVSARDECNK